MDQFEQPGLRTVQPAELAGAVLPHGPGVNELAQLVGDLLGATNLLPPDKLALARGRAGQSGSLAQALIDEGLAAADGIARALAARYQLPLIDLTSAGVDREAARMLPGHVLERIVALPFSFDGSRLHVAVADPANVHSIDELRIATHHPIELAVASRDDILLELRKLVRATTSSGAHSAVVEEEQRLAAVEAGEGDDLDAEDGIS